MGAWPWWHLLLLSSAAANPCRPPCAATLPQLQAHLRRLGIRQASVLEGVSSFDHREALTTGARPDSPLASWLVSVPGLNCLLPQGDRANRVLWGCPSCWNC